MSHPTATPRHPITHLKPAQVMQNRSPAPTPSPPQQMTTNATQPSLVGMSKEEKAAEMNRRKEERKQVSGADLISSLPTANNAFTAYCSAEGPKSFGWEAVKRVSRSEGPFALAGAQISLFLRASP